MRCQQPLTNYPQFTCSSTATFRVRWVKPDERGDRQLIAVRSCAQHLAKACRIGLDETQPDHYSVQVIDLREEK